MALPDEALTTVVTAKAYSTLLASLADSVVEARILYVTAVVGQLCERKFAKAQVTERHLGGQACVLLSLNRPPIVGNEATITVLDDVDSSAVTDHVINDAEAGILERVVGWPPRYAGFVGTGLVPVGELPRWRVTYTGGWVTPTMVGTRDLPYDIEMAALETLAYWASRPAEKSALTSEAALSASQSWDTKSTSTALPPRALSMLAPYRRQVGFLALGSLG